MRINQRINSIKKMKIKSSPSYEQKHKPLKILAFLIIFLSGQVYSKCNNCNQIINLNIKKELTLSGNTVGHKEESDSFTPNIVDLGYGGVSYKSVSFSDINGTVPSYGTVSNKEVYQKVDDYFSIAIYETGNCGVYYEPSNTAVIQTSTCKVGKTNDTYHMPTFHSKIRIDRPLVGGDYVKHIFLGRMGICNGEGCSSPTDTIATVYLNYNITVPQNCVINAGEVVSVDFGSIPSTAFKSPGQIAERVTPVTRQLTMQCTNIEPFKNMSVRLQADKVSGNAIVSDNKDVGFVLGDSDRRPLTPNQFTSSIPFTLSGANAAIVPVTIWPVSVTGRTPAEGRVSAVGFLRVDFD